MEKMKSFSSFANNKLSVDYFENYNDSFKNSITKNLHFFDSVGSEKKNKKDNFFFKKLFKVDNFENITEMDKKPFKNDKYPDLFSLTNINDIESEYHKDIEKKNKKMILSSFTEIPKKNINIILPIKEKKKILPKKQKESRKLKTQQKIINKFEKENNYISEISKQKKLFNLEGEIKNFRIYERNYNSKRTRFSTKLKNFKKICHIVTHTFLGKNLKSKDIIDLDEKQLFILCEIFKKKYDLKFEVENSKNKYIKKIFEIHKNLINKISKKRIEEKIKFIYKNTLKSLKIKYINENNFQNNKKSIESFYNFYFKDLAKKLNIPLKSFYDPLNLKGGFKQKSINFKFLKLVFSSKKFKNHFFKYLTYHFKYLYQKNLIKKVDAFFYKFEKKYFREPDEIKNKHLIDYLKSSKKIKFPWSFFEIENATEFFIKKVNLLGNN